MTCTQRPRIFVSITPGSRIRRTSLTWTVLHNAGLPELRRAQPTEHAAIRSSGTPSRGRCMAGEGSAIPNPPTVARA